MLAGFDPGANVLHPAHGLCRVVGVEHVAAAGESFDALAIAPQYATRAVVKIPLHKVADHGLRVLTPAEVEHVLDHWQPPTARLRAWRLFLIARGQKRSQERQASARRMAASAA